MTSEGASPKQARRAAAALVGAYHEARLAELLEHVREGFTRYDAGDIDAFELDELVHHYKRSARELWKLCAASGAQVETVARTLEYWTAEGEQPDWWEAGSPRNRR